MVPQPSLQGRVRREAVVGSRLLVEHQLCQDLKLLAVLVEIDKPILLNTTTLSTETSQQSFVRCVGQGYHMCKHTGSFRVKNYTTQSCGTHMPMFTVNCVSTNQN